MSEQAGQPEPAKRTRNWGKIAAVAATLVAVLAVGIFAAILIVDDPGSSQDADSFKPAFPPGGPAEFLYLDAARVATYLAQIEGGKVESEQLSRKLTQSLKAGLALKDVADAEAAKETELLAERTVKPTAASSFFALQARLEDAGALHEIRPRYFDGVEDLREGSFVQFQTSALLSPIYINAYLAVLHAGTLAAIFPQSRAQRKAATNFFAKVGPTGRAVFAIQPYAEVSKRGEAPLASSEAGRKPFVYLLPITAQQLSSERSLLKYGGGAFTVLGKLVRRFPEATNRHLPAYVDSATEETWEQALKRAPADLLCRTEPQCAKAVRRPGLSDAAREAKAEVARTQILAALDRQTKIEQRGAVILPIGIYK